MQSARSRWSRHRDVWSRGVLGLGCVSAGIRMSAAALTVVALRTWPYTSWPCPGSWPDAATTTPGVLRGRRLESALVRETHLASASVWPLVGRDVELAEIALARSDRSCCGVVISASAGVGKSRLAREACAGAQAVGVPTLWAQATASSATIPLGALAALIPAELRSGDPLALVRGSCAAVRAASDGGTVLFAVDDAHLLDSVSATVVLQLAATPDVFVLATVRTGEPTPDAVDSLWKDAGARRIELERVSDEAIVQLVEAGLDGPVEHATMRQIVDACAGNPLYARELVIGAIEDGRMRRVRGLWRMEGRPGVSPSLRALIKRRIGALDPDVLRPLELLALGEPLRVGELAALTSLEALLSGEERGMLAVTSASDDADVRLAHPLYSDVIRAEMPVLRARGHRLRLADSIQQRHPLDSRGRAPRRPLAYGRRVPRSRPSSCSTPPTRQASAIQSWPWCWPRAPPRPALVWAPCGCWRAHTRCLTASSRPRTCLPPPRRRPRVPPPRGHRVRTRRWSCTSDSECTSSIGGCGGHRTRGHFWRVPSAGRVTQAG